MLFSWIGKADLASMNSGLGESKLELKNYNDTFNLIFGTKNETINLLDNPYLRFNLYEITEKWDFKISKK